MVKEIKFFVGYSDYFGLLIVIGCFDGCDVDFGYCYYCFEGVFGISGGMKELVEG